MVEIKYINEMLVNGLSTRTKNSDELNQETAKIPTLWQQVHARGYDKNTALYGVYTDYESDATGAYTLTVGAPHTDELNDLQQNQVRITAGNYLVFKKRGPMPFAVIELWQLIWQYFTENNTHERNFLSDFELYNGTEEAIVYIGVK